MLYISRQIWPTDKALLFESGAGNSSAEVISGFGICSQFPRNEVFLAVNAFAFSIVLSPLWLLSVKTFHSHNFSVSILIAQLKFLRLKYKAL